MVEKDPYVKEIEESVQGVLEGMEPFPWHIAFQSKGGGPEEWIGPDVESVLEELVQGEDSGGPHRSYRICVGPYRNPLRH